MSRKHVFERVKNTLNSGGLTACNVPVSEISLKINMDSEEQCRLDSVLIDNIEFSIGFDF